MRKNYKKVLVLVVASIFLFIAACGNNNGSNVIDETKNHLYISAYDAGYGRAWLEMYEREFEAFYKDKSFEDGKTGVDVHIDWNQASSQGMISGMKGSDNQIYFNSVDYYDLVVSGNALDLTEILNEDLAEFGESGKNVISKIPEDLRKYLSSVNEGKIYGVPSTDTWTGITYDRDLFELKSLYLASNYDESPLFTSGRAGTLPKSKGPDNLLNTYDDGLPATVEQLYQLLDYMVNIQSVIPFTFSAYLGYSEMLPMALWANFEGKEQMSLNFTFDGTAIDLITVTESGEIKPDKEPTVINNSNGYELVRQKGIYQALKVIENLVDNKEGKNYFSINAFAGDQDHIAAQEEYLYSFPDGKPIAFLVEGTYWTAESAGIFKDMSGEYGDTEEEYSVYGRNFAHMPLPHYDSTRVGEKQTIVSSTLNCVAKSNQEGVDYELTKKFIQFINTDKMIYQFIKEAGYPRALKAIYSDEQISTLTPYAKSLIETQKNSDMLYPVSTNPQYIANTSGILYFNTNKNGWCFRMNSSYQQPVKNMYDDGNGTINAFSYFTNMYTTMKLDWPKLKK